MKFLIQDKKWSRLKNPNFVTLQQKNVVAKEISSYEHQVKWKMLFEIKTRGRLEVEGVRGNQNF